MLAFLTELFHRLDASSPAIAPVTVRPNDATRIIALRTGYALTPLPCGAPVRPARLHVFADVASFAEWAVRHLSPETTEILAAPEKIVAISAHEHERDQVTCALQKDPRWLALVGQLGRPLDQQVAFRLVSGLRDRIEGAGSFLAQVSTLEIRTAGVFKMSVDPRTGARKGSFVEGNTEYPVNLPTEIVVTGPIYLNGQTVSVTFDVLLELDNGKPMIRLLDRDRVEMEHVAFVGELRTLVEALAEKPGFLVGRGALALG